MVIGVTSLTGNGLRDWLIQRVSAIVLTVYVLFLIGYVMAHPNFNHTYWYQLFSYQWMKIFTVLVLLNLILHSWVGIWTVITDYINCAYFRLFITIAMILALLSYFVWGIAILWGF